MKPSQSAGFYEWTGQYIIPFLVTPVHYKSKIISNILYKFFGETHFSKLSKTNTGSMDGLWHVNFDPISTW